MHSDGRQAWWGTADEVHAHCPDQLIASKTGEQRIQTNKQKIPKETENSDVFGCKPLTFTCKILIADMGGVMQMRVCAPHAFMRFHASKPQRTPDADISSQVVGKR